MHNYIICVYIIYNIINILLYIIYYIIILNDIDVGEIVGEIKDRRYKKNKPYPNSRLTL